MFSRGLRHRFGPLMPAVLVVVAMHARFITTPISTDEGGYFAVARAWARGGVLYRDAWVDRPQGLLVLFRFFDAIGLGTPEGIRVMAILFCLLAVVACGDIAATLAGERARWMAATATGVLLSVPQIEGFIANGELLAGAVGAAALALMLRATWNSPVPRLWACCAAGIVGGCALSLKQSGFDGFGAALVAIVVVMIRDKRGVSTTAKTLAAALAGFALPVAAMVVHGALTGWSRWWSAVAGYRFSQRSADDGADWDLLRTTTKIAAPIMIPLVVVLAVVGVALLISRRLPPAELVVLATWFAAGSVGFMAGGHFHRHYWLIFMAPLGTTLAVFLARLTRESLAVVGLGVVMVAPLAMTISAVLGPRDTMGVDLHGDKRVDRNEAVAAWLSQRDALDEPVYAMCASSGLYGLLESDPPFPYLWFDGVRHFPGARERLVNLLSGDTGPRYVVIYQSAIRCDPSGTVEAALAANYIEVDEVAGMPVLERTIGSGP